MDGHDSSARGFFSWAVLAKNLGLDRGEGPVKVSPSKTLSARTARGVDVS